ncbi:hypothetical protein FRACYDRAFT_248609 [Fragilariopsis cylindrus CCMP1102]|uniref:Uncharacterized protein n=1 Tax=Fragilariopsis cylindrus CCMP1102 TaxID=635003 RepID=A0A1E7EUR3_9STRA|nr:hypothetical protein FRACYDRAFT_248609 [Fragilariopsis cylindrus CCMP1102]|eukprot:OEU09273.1 hypothetical protein FRACYDRAFT_248609 [Fragilariopsis cylindrus CCMP1102]
MNKINYDNSDSTKKKSAAVVDVVVTGESTTSIDNRTRNNGRGKAKVFDAREKHENENIYDNRGDNDNHEDENENDSREYLTKEKCSWITFRTAHAGDAAPIAHWYRRQRSEERCRHRRQHHQRMPPITNIEHDDDEEDEEDHDDEDAVVDDDEEPEIDKHQQNQSSNATLDGEVFNIRNNHRRDSDSSNTNSNIDSNNNSNLEEGEKENNNDDEEETSSLQLEHWLAEGLGDENSCPSVYGMLAYVHCSSSSLPVLDSNTKKNSDQEDKDSNSSNNNNNNNNNNQTISTEKNDRPSDNSAGSLAAVVLLSLAWTSGKRNLRIEWMAVDPQLPFHHHQQQEQEQQRSEEVLAIEQKVWLRINTLSIMTACQAISIDEDVLLMTSSSTATTSRYVTETSLDHDNNMVNINNKKKIQHRVEPTAG